MTYRKFLYLIIVRETIKALALAKELESSIEARKGGLTG